MNKENKEKKEFKLTDEKKQLLKDIAAWSIVVIGLLLVLVGLVYGIVDLATITEGENIGLPTLELSFSLFIATFISFGLLIAAVYFLFWEKIEKSLDTRQKNVKANIAIASYKAAQAEKNLEESEQTIKESKIEGKEIVDAHKKEGNEIKKEIISEAKEQSESMLGKTREQIEREKQQMEDDIRKQILETSLLAAEKIIEKELDQDANQKMINELIEKLK